MKILIFGSTGFLGQNFMYHKSNKDHEILSPDRDKLDLFDKKKVFDYIRLNKPDLIINCAGKVGGIAANLDNSFDFLNENLLLNSNVIISSYENKIKKLINFGSSCMYPSQATNPLLESEIMNGKFEITNEGFALAKTVSLKLCDYISKKNEGYFYRTIIPCNMFGKFDHYGNINRSHMIAAAIKKIYDAKLNNKIEVQVWGSGKVRREYTNAYNVADFVYANLDKIEEFPNYFNLGTNTDFTIKEYYQMIMEIFDLKANLVFDKSKPDGIYQKLINTKYPFTLNWTEPKNLKFSLTEAVEYYKNYAQKN